MRKIIIIHGLILLLIMLVSCPTEPDINDDEEFSFSVYVDGVLVESFPCEYDFGQIPVFQVSDIIEVEIVNTSEDQFYALHSWDGYELVDSDGDDFIHRYGEYTQDDNSPVSPFGNGESTYLYFAFNPQQYGSSSAEIHIPFSKNIGAENEAENTDVVLQLSGSTSEPSEVGDIFYFNALPTSSAVSYSSPSYYEGYVYMGTSRPLAETMATDNYFYKLDEELNIVWNTSLGEAEVLGGTAFDSAGDAYFVVRTNRGIDDVSETNLYLYKVSSETGEIQFTEELDPFREEIGVIYWNPAIATNGTAGVEDDLVYVGGGNLRAYDTDGNLYWEYSDDSNEPFCALKGIRLDDAGNIYASGIHRVDSDVKLHVMSFTSDRTLRWDFESEVWGGVGTLAFNYDFSRIYAPLSRRMYCLDTENGQEIWNYLIDRDYESLYIPVAPAVDGDGNLYFGIKENADSIFYSLDASGALRWSFPLYGDGYPSPVLGSSDVLYIGSEMLPYDMTGSYTVGETFRAIDPATGSKLWGTQLSKDCCHSHPLLLNNGMLYIAATMLNSERAIIYAIMTESTEGYASDAGNACFMDASNRSGSRER